MRSFRHFVPFRLVRLVKVQHDCPSVERRHLVLVLVEHDAVGTVLADARLGKTLAIGRGRHAKAVAIATAAVVEQAKLLQFRVPPQPSRAGEPSCRLLPVSVRAHERIVAHLALVPAAGHRLLIH